MPALRSHLEFAGFDGLLWQAGHGNPVALNNFLLESASQGGEKWSRFSMVGLPSSRVLKVYGHEIVIEENGEVRLVRRESRIEAAFGICKADRSVSDADMEKAIRQRAGR